MEWKLCSIHNKKDPFISSLEKLQSCTLKYFNYVGIFLYFTKKNIFTKTYMLLHEVVHLIKMEELKNGYITQIILK